MEARNAQRTATTGGVHCAALRCMSRVACCVAHEVCRAGLCHPRPRIVDRKRASVLPKGSEKDADDDDAGESLIKLGKHPPKPTLSFLPTADGAQYRRFTARSATV
jgi:hypothetical protein